MIHKRCKYFCREIGEGEWFECNKSFYERCIASPEWDTRKEVYESDYKDIAERLWQLLDDIDTYCDIMKPELTEYVKGVNEKCRERHDLLETDGYDLFLPKGVMDE